MYLNIAVRLDGLGEINENIPRSITLLLKVPQSILLRSSSMRAQSSVYLPLPVPTVIGGE